MWERSERTIHRSSNVKIRSAVEITSIRENADAAPMPPIDASGAK